VTFDQAIDQLARLERMALDLEASGLAVRVAVDVAVRLELEPAVTPVVS
jgi:hypothetical protein